LNARNIKYAYLQKFFISWQIFAKASFARGLITEGLRTKERQLQLYGEGKTKTLNSKHLEGKAIDICPVIKGKLDFSKEAEPDLYFILGLFYLKAKELLEKYELSGGSEGLNIKLRLGAFWDRNSIRENSEGGFVDGYHIEIEN
jgi:hypothetical protein